MCARNGLPGRLRSKKKGEGKEDTTPMVHEYARSAIDFPLQFPVYNGDVNLPEHRNINQPSSFMINDY